MSIQLQRLGDSLQIKISPDSYKDNQLQLIKACSSCLMNQTTEDLELVYRVPEYWKSVEELRNEKLTKLERLELTSTILSLTFSTNQLNIPFINPQNIYIYGNHAKIVHYGVEQFLYPFSLSKEERLRRIKSLVAIVISPNLKFEETMTTLCLCRHPILKKVAACESIDDLIHTINQAYLTLRNQSKRTKIILRKKTLQVLMLSFILSIAFSLAVGFSYFQKIYPTYEINKAVIKAQQSFIKQDYGQTTKKLSGIKLEELDKEVKWILAVSAVHIDSLNNQQKKTILPAITSLTTEELLDFWILVGRGQFEEALNIAKVLGDNQLILHAYTHLFESIEANRKMDGEAKEKQLKEIENHIKSLIEELPE